MYFKFFKLQDWGKRSGEGRRRNRAVLPKEKWRGAAQKGPLSGCVGSWKNTP